MKKISYQNISDVISLLRFPLALFVVFIHVEGRYFNFENISTGTFLITHFISNIICKVAVPTFFFISGFLFFFKIKEFSTEVYLTKKKKRIKSLLIPYIIWNTIAFLVFMLAKFVGVNSFVTNFSLGDDIISNIVKIYGYTVSWKGVSIIHVPFTFRTPIDGPLWFIRDLMILSVLSPLIYWLIRSFGFYLLIVLFGILLLFGHPSYTALFYFSLGCYFSITNRDPLEFYIKYKWIIWICIFLLVFPAFVKGSVYKNILLVPMVFSILGCSQFLSNSMTISLKNLSYYSFCIYVTHAIFSLPISAKLFSLLNVSPLIYYFGVGISSIAISIMIYYILCPFTKWLRIV